MHIARKAPSYPGHFSTGTALRSGSTSKVDHPQMRSIEQTADSHAEHRYYSQSNQSSRVPSLNHK